MSAMPPTDRRPSLQVSPHASTASPSTTERTLP